MLVLVLFFYSKSLSLSLQAIKQKCQQKLNIFNNNARVGSYCKEWCTLYREWNLLVLVLIYCGI
jgi:hypothetical protein